MDLEVGGGETISSAGCAQAFGRAVHAISSHVLVCFKVVHEKSVARGGVDSPSFDYVD
jgi:hypothetical protein